MKIAIIGTGVYSTALTYHLQKMKDNDIYLWAKNEKTVNIFHKKKKFEFLPQTIKFDSNIYVSNNLEEVMKDASVLFILVGSKYMTDILKEMKSFYHKNTPIFVGTKGMDIENLRFYSDMTRKLLKCNCYTFFAGPTFAKDLLSDIDFSLTFAGSNKIGYKVLNRIFPDYIKKEFTFDLYGLEMLSVLKNIYAIGSGILHSQKIADSTYYSYVTEVVKEAKNIIAKCDGCDETLLSYGGIGDLLMTLNSKNSRNFTFGKMIGSKAKEEELENYKNKNTIEGYDSLQNVPTLIKKLKLNHSILEKIYKIVYEQQEVELLLPKRKETSDTF